MKEVKIKLLKPGCKPIKKTDGAAAYDVRSGQEATIIAPNETVIIKLGFCVEVPEGYYLEVRGRSGWSSHGLLCHTGTVDSDYRGEVGAILTNVSNENLVINKGERCGQIMLKKVEDYGFVEVTELSITLRGNGGFGSTGKN